MTYQDHDLVKTCGRLESGLRLGQEGIHACQLGQLSSPIYWSADEAARTSITKEMIVEKRKWLFELLNDGHSDISCRGCKLVRTKRYADIDFTRLGHIDLAATTICNLRCAFCGYTKRNEFHASKYDALAILREFSAEDVEWDSVVEFNGGEPALLRDMDEFLDYFASRRIRVILYTNAVEFRQSIYDRLADGSVQWVCTSLDAGTPSSFLHLKKRDHYLQVLENLARYAHAGSQGGGMLAVKYIFCDGNCDDDDVVGFTYTMLAIRPQKIWLTFDFEPLCGIPGDSPDFGGYDYSRHVAAYAKMYALLKKHGMNAVHYTEGHLATCSLHGRILMERVLSEIDRYEINEAPGIMLKDFRQDEQAAFTEPLSFSTMPLRIRAPHRDPEPWSLRGKRVLLAPAYPLTTGLLSDQDIKEAHILGFIDRDQVLHGKSIQGVPVYGYHEIPGLAPDVILVAPPKQHKTDILKTLAKHAAKDTCIAVFE
jgi:uncharacterized Fe-S cluster-containing radical SAM superfamily protein